MRTGLKQKHTRKRQDESEMAKVLCWSQSWETWALVFTTHLTLDKLLSLSVPAFHLLSQCRDSNGCESIPSIKCYLNMGTVVTTGKIRYQKQGRQIRTSWSKLKVSNS